MTRFEMEDITGSPPYAIPTSFVVYQYGGKTYAENLRGGTDVTPSTDAATVIQAALNALSGGTLFIKNGTYSIASTISLPGNIRIEMEPSTILQASSAINWLMLCPNTRNNIFIRGGIIDGNSNASDGINLSALSVGEVNSVEVKNCLNYGIHTVDSVYVNLTGCYIHNNILNGIVLSMSGAGAVSHCAIFGNKIVSNGSGAVTDGGIYTSKAFNSIITHNIVVNNNLIGILVGSSHRSVCNNNTVEGSNSVGIYIDFTNEAVCCGNSLLNNTTYGIDNTSAAIGGGTIIGNHVEGSTTGIYDDQPNARIIGNTIVGSTTPVSIAGSPANVQILNNAGFNPQGWATTSPAVPASGADQQNVLGYPLEVYLTGLGSGITAVGITDPAGTLTSFTRTGEIGDVYHVEPSGKIRLTYTGSPTWKWYGL